MVEHQKAKVHELDLHRKRLSRIEGLDKFKHLHSLDASCNKLTKIQGLEQNKELRELKLYGNEITVIEGLDKLSDLCVLLLQHNKIASIGTGLSNLKKLKQLRLDHNHLTSVSHSDLVSCGNHMTHLDLSHNLLTSVQGLGSLGNLEELYLAGNKLTCPPDLARCRKLTELNLSDNPLTLGSLSSSLKPLNQLKVLCLDRIALCDLSPLPKLVSLDTLHLSGNSLDTLAPLVKLYPSLEVLDVGDNCLATVEAVGGLQQLASLSEIMLEGNSLCQHLNDYRKDVHSVLQRLEMIDGVAVSLLTPTLPHPLQMRPLTPSSIGPTLRQMERHFLEAELQLQGLEGEMTARFDLTRAKMEATMRENEVRLRNDGVASPKKRYENEQPPNGNRALDVPTSEGDSDVVQSSRPSTRCGSRAKLSEALALAALYPDHMT